MKDASTCLLLEREELGQLFCQDHRLAHFPFIFCFFLQVVFLQGLVESLEVKAVVTLQEDVQVPAMPEIQVPERYQVYI